VLHREYGVFHLFCGIGGGALGFQGAEAEWRGLHGRFRTLGGIDVDPEACADFEALTGARATRLDLFTRADYTAFHGEEPPQGWREATPADVRAAAGGRFPDVVFTSSPCKGLSALLPKAQAESSKYEALNNLTVRGIRLALDAWADRPPRLIIFENVPRITSRGAPLLARIKDLLGGAGYAVADGYHDAGEIGGLSQHRRRYLLVARHAKRLPAFLYQPPGRRVHSIGHALRDLPPPGDPAGGPMHRLPRLQWLTWVRLALIPAGGDWRDLQGIEPGSYAIEPVRCPHFNHVMEVTPWDAAAGAVTGGTGPSQGAVSVADPRLPGGHWTGHYRVVRWTEPARTVTGKSGDLGSNAGMVVADPRIPQRPTRHSGDLAVRAWGDAAHTVTGEDSVGSGAQAVSDPRLGHEPRKGVFQVAPWEEPAPTVVGAASVRGSNGVAAVADPRLTCTPHSGAYGVVRWDDPAPTVTASGDVHAQGAAAVADPRIPGEREQGAWIIVAEDGTWHRPLTTLELAVLQGFPAEMPDGRPLALAGSSQARWRERIGNAVPPPAARAIGETMLQALVPCTAGGFTFVLSAAGTAIWVCARVGAAARALPRVSRRSALAAAGVRPGR
jgi:site-specific DNA-cytosine methylase